MGKKVDGLLKGAAITGAAIGGVSALADASLAYAYDENMELPDEIDLELTQETTQEHLGFL